MNNNQEETEPIAQPLKKRKAKEARWLEMAADVDETVDALGRHLDKGIKDTVIALNLLGFETDSSCEGHTKHGECGPWLGLTSESIKALEPEREKLFEKVKEKGYMDKKTQKRIDEINLEGTKEQARAMELIAGFYQDRKVPYDTMIIVHPAINGIIQCMGTDLTKLLLPDQKAAKLKQYQAEMAEFTKFLKDKYFNS